MTPIQNNALKLDAWSNSSQNYQEYIGGNQVEDFSIFDYQSLGDTPEVRGKAYGEQVQYFAQDYLNQYDTDADGEMNYSEFVDMQQKAEIEAFGESAPTEITEEDKSLLDGTMSGLKSFLNKALTVLKVNENYQTQFEQLSTLDSEDSTTISAQEYGAFIGVADGQDDKGIDGNITYENFQTAPMQEGYDEALKNYYNDFS